MEQEPTLPQPPIISEELMDDSTIADFTDLHQERLENARDIESYQLPELPEDHADEIYERLLEAERQIATTDLTRRGYNDGTAQTPDEIAEFLGTHPALLTAEHATAHYRAEQDDEPKKRKGPDRGTGGLGYLLHQDLGATFLAMRGRQTGDANWDDNHPLKQRVTDILSEQTVAVSCSIHGMSGGKFSDFIDERGYDVLIGIGDTPNEASVALAQKIERIAGDLGLRAATNEWFIKVADHDPLVPERHDDGTIVFSSYYSPHYTTRAHAQCEAERLKLNIASVQIELSDLLRFLPLDIERDEKTRRIGTYLGYLLMARSIA